MDAIVKSEHLVWNYAFDVGHEVGFDQGKEEGFKAGVEAAISMMFGNVYNFEYAAKCVETFIKKFNEKFPWRSILQARIGINQSSMESTAFFITNVSDEEYESVIELTRVVEREIEEKEGYNPVCLWTVQNEDLCEDTIKIDFPFMRKAL